MTTPIRSSHQKEFSEIVVPEIFIEFAVNHPRMGRILLKLSVFQLFCGQPSETFQNPAKHLKLCLLRKWQNAPFYMFDMVLNTPLTFRKLFLLHERWNSPMKYFYFLNFQSTADFIYRVILYHLFSLTTFSFKLFIFSLLYLPCVQSRVAYI